MPGAECSRVLSRDTSTHGIERFSSGEALSRLIAQVFRSMFSDARFTPEYCADVAEAIMADARDQMR